MIEEGEKGANDGECGGEQREPDHAPGEARQNDACTHS
jgi:hypothetical protein